MEQYFTITLTSNFSILSFMFFIAGVGDVNWDDIQVKIMLNIPCSVWKYVKDRYL